jgi:hypothetical protein
MGDCDPAYMSKWTAHGKEQITEKRGLVALPNGWSGTKHVKRVVQVWNAKRGCFEETPN